MLLYPSWGPALFMSFCTPVRHVVHTVGLHVDDMLCTISPELIKTATQNTKTTAPSPRRGLSSCNSTDATRSGRTSTWQSGVPAVRGEDMHLPSPGGCAQQQTPRMSFKTPERQQKATPCRPVLK